jgi:hypothetical protein
MEERLSIAREFVDKHEYQVTTLVDTMENAFDHEYGLHSPHATRHTTRRDARARLADSRASASSRQVRGVA